MSSFSAWQVRAAVEEVEVTATTAEEVAEIFRDLGFTKFHISTSRRVMHRVYLTVQRGPKGKRSASQLTFTQGEAEIVVVAGYYPPKLDSRFKGVRGCKVSLRAFYNLIETGVIKQGNR